MPRPGLLAQSWLASHSNLPSPAPNLSPPWPLSLAGEPTTTWEKSLMATIIVIVIRQTQTMEL
eukprot:scaffold7929_cov106-Isochrysis_galbana.AAC.2